MADPTIIIAKKMWTKEEWLKSQLAPGKPRGRTAGGWVSDIAAQKQTILLCALCTHKFNPKRANYRKEKEMPFAMGTCDGCGVSHEKCSWYVYEPLYSQIRVTADDVRATRRQRELGIKHGDMDWRPGKW